MQASFDFGHGNKLSISNGSIVGDAADRLPVYSRNVTIKHNQAQNPQGRAISHRNPICNKTPAAGVSRLSRAPQMQKPGSKPGLV
jgi:hypothetical protein